jgi:hypothetical protein
MIRAALLFGIATFALGGPAANSADMMSLEVGDFNIASDSIVKPHSVSVVNGKKLLTLSMQLDSLVAHADGSKIEASSSMEGNFIVQQPHQLVLPSMTVQLHGHIVKTLGSTASLDVTIGSALKTIKWNADEATARQFNITIIEPIVNGELPVVLPVSAIALVNKNAGTGAVLISLDRIDVNIGQVKVASGQ